MCTYAYGLGLLYILNLCLCRKIHDKAAKKQVWFYWGREHFPTSSFMTKQPLFFICSVVFLSFAFSPFSPPPTFIHNTFSMLSWPLSLSRRAFIPNERAVPIKHHLAKNDLKSSAGSKSQTEKQFHKWLEDLPCASS